MAQRPTSMTGPAGLRRPVPVSIGTVPATTDTDTLVDPTLSEVDEGDHDRFSHYVRKDHIMRSAVEGGAVRALCGKKWIPNRDPEKFPVCPECKEIMAKLKALGR